MQKNRKVALVTGGNKGIGFEVAKMLLEKDISVIIGSRNVEKGKQAVKDLGGENVSFVQVDITNEKSVETAKNVIANDFGKLDILINNAGIWLDFGVPMLEVSMDDIEATFKVNTFGVITTIKHFLPLLKESKEGRIVNVSSGLGSLKQSADPNYEYYPYKSLAYNTSKSALNALTILFAFELKETNIKINSADPGYCSTDLNGKTGPRTPKQGANIVVELATLPENDSTCGFFDENGSIEW
ncbi:MAG: SDR family oxidoreductase [Flavobacteriaceae bacterium]